MTMKKIRYVSDSCFCSTYYLMVCSFYIITVSSKNTCVTCSQVSFKSGYCIEINKKMKVFI